MQMFWGGRLDGLFGWTLQLTLYLTAKCFGWVRFSWLFYVDKLTLHRQPRNRFGGVVGLVVLIGQLNSH